MPNLQDSRPPCAPSLSDSGLKAACSVSELAARCGLSRARWYELVNAEVMPQPVYCLHTRRPLYPRELQEAAIKVRMTNMTADGRYVLFYGRRERSASPTRLPRAASRSTERATSAATSDTPVSELIESLRVLGIEQPDFEIKAAVSDCYPGGVPNDFEMALTTVFRHLRRRDRAR